MAVGASVDHVPGGGAAVFVLPMLLFEVSRELCVANLGLTRGQNIRLQGIESGLWAVSLQGEPGHVRAPRGEVEPSIGGVRLGDTLSREGKGEEGKADKMHLGLEVEVLGR